MQEIKYLTHKVAPKGLEFPAHFGINVQEKKILPTIGETRRNGRKRGKNVKAPLNFYANDLSS